MKILMKCALAIIFIFPIGTHSSIAYERGYYNTTEGLETLSVCQGVFTGFMAITQQSSYIQYITTMNQHLESGWSQVGVSNRQIQKWKESGLSLIQMFAKNNNSKGLQKTMINCAVRYKEFSS